MPAARNEEFNIGADGRYSVKELAETVMQAMDSRSDLRYLDARSEVVHARADHGKLTQVFGNGSHTSLLDGLRRMAGWAETVGIKKSSRLPEIEILERIAPVWLED